MFQRSDLAGANAIRPYGIRSLSPFRSLILSKYFQRPGLFFYTV